MKRIIVLAICLVFICSCVNVQAIELKKPLVNISIKKIEEKAVVGNALCPTCVNLLDFALADLYAAVDSGVIFSCLGLCKHVSKYGNYAVEACDIICSAIGANAFIQVIKKADLDPIYGCQLANICPIHDCTAKVCAVIDTAGIVPATGPAGAKYSFYARLNVLNESGPGQVVLGVTGQSIAKNQVGYRYYQADGFKPGAYGIKFEINTNDDETWAPGAYQAKVDVCEGECGSWVKRPHSRNLASAIASFNITGTPI